MNLLSPHYKFHGAGIRPSKLKPSQAIPTTPLRSTPAGPNRDGVGGLSYRCWALCFAYARRAGKFSKLTAYPPQEVNG